MYGGKQQVDARKQDRKERLVKDIRSWLNIPEPAPVPTPEPTPNSRTISVPTQASTPLSTPTPIVEDHHKPSLHQKDESQRKKSSVDKAKILRRGVLGLVIVGVIALLSVFVSKCNSGNYKVIVDDNLFTINNVTFEMIPVEGGTFWMGAEPLDSVAYDESPYDDKSPVHQVTLSDYYIGKYEVTQALWMAVMGNNPSRFKGDNLPVEQVLWDDCQDFIKKLNKITGKNFRLPTEAEWEYAARGGNNSCGYKYAGSNSIGDVAWYANNSSKTHPVGTKKPNELGIYDMSGNVWEWCQDWYDDYSSSSQTNPTGPTTGSYRVNRGGGWGNGARYCRVSSRRGYAPDFGNSNLGLRLCLSSL